MEAPSVNASLQPPAGAAFGTGRAVGRTAGGDRGGPAPAWAAALAGLVGRLELLSAAVPLAAGPGHTGAGADTAAGIAAGAAAGAPPAAAAECLAACPALGGGLDAVAEHIAARAAAADPGRVAIRFGAGRLAGVSCQVLVERGRVRCRLRAGGAPCREALRGLRGRLALRLADRGLALEDFGVEP
jgi:hypothetical protein